MKRLGGKPGKAGTDATSGPAKAAAPKKTGPTRKARAATVAAANADKPSAPKAAASRPELWALSDHEISDMLLHGAAVIKFRTSATTSTSNFAAAVDYCYTKSGGSTDVTVWHGPFKVGVMPQSEAVSRGYLPCGG